LLDFGLCVLLVELLLLGECFHVDVRADGLLEDFPLLAFALGQLDLLLGLLEVGQVVGGRDEVE
jgi:hypothetical protein